MSEFTLDDIKPNIEECIKRRLRYTTFCRTLLFLEYKFNVEKCDFVYPSELRKFLNLSQQRAYQILSDFVTLKLLEVKKISGNMVEFHPVRDEKGNLVISKYRKEAIKTINAFSK